MLQGIIVFESIIVTWKRIFPNDSSWLNNKIWARCSLEMLVASSIAFLQFSTDFGYSHSAQSVKPVVSPSCLAWISLWPLAVISPSSSKVFPIADLPVSWHQADQRLRVQEELLFRGHCSANGRWETDRKCSFFHLPGRLFGGALHVLLRAPGRVSHQSTK